MPTCAGASFAVIVVELGRPVDLAVTDLNVTKVLDLIVAEPLTV